MPVLVSLADVRDVFIIIYGTLGIIFFIVATVVAVIIGMTVKSLLNSVKEMMDESIKPAVASVKDAAETVRGTTDFVGRTTVQPIAKVYGTVSGVKRGMTVLGNFKRNRRA
jgi:hypothetical protein